MNISVQTSVEGGHTYLVLESETNAEGSQIRELIGDLKTYDVRHNKGSETIQIHLVTKKKND